MHLPTPPTPFIKNLFDSGSSDSKQWSGPGFAFAECWHSKTLT
jgi:hypothetical protein